MTKVYNWQLGREMLYPYEESHPKRQFAFVFNINRCIGCQCRNRKNRKGTRVAARRPGTG